jgi:hypothetical protein
LNLGPDVFAVKQGRRIPPSAGRHPLRRKGLRQGVGHVNDAAMVMDPDLKPASKWGNDQGRVFIWLTVSRQCFLAMGFVVEGWNRLRRLIMAIGDTKRFFGFERDWRIVMYDLCHRLPRANGHHGR